MSTAPFEYNGTTPNNYTSACYSNYANYGTKYGHYTNNCQHTKIIPPQILSPIPIVFRLGVKPHAIPNQVVLK